MKTKRLQLCIMHYALCIIIAGCSQDSYDKGTGKYSLTRADFVVAHSDAEKNIDYVVTDDGERLTLDSRPTAKWIVTADSTYRAILYYNRNDDETTVTPISVSRVPTLTLRRLETDEPMQTDPITFESLWIAGGYVNLGIYVKTGKTDDEEAEGQTVSFVHDDTRTAADGKTTALVTFFHDQGDIPEYYSQHYYLSLPVDSVATDSLELTINTYDGIVKKTYPLGE